MKRLVAVLLALIVAFALAIGARARFAARDAAQSAAKSGARATHSAPGALLEREKEIALAKSAGLPEWTEQADIYWLRADGFVKVQSGTNGFSCLVIRERPGTQHPVCYDPEGTRAIVPRFLEEAKLRAAGRTEEEIIAASTAAFRSGKYSAPKRAGIGYMLSRENYVWIGSSARWFPPHLMIYAPNLKNADIGVVMNRMPLSPMIIDEGTPHAQIVAVVPDNMPVKH